MPLPLLPLITAAAGGIQSIINAGKAKKAQKELEGMNSPLYKKNQGILDYYNQSLDRYNVSPTDSAMYKRQIGNINRGVANGVGALQDRRSGIAGISSILRGASDATLNAEATAEQERNNRFNQLGTATQMKAGEDRTAFDINEMQPFERKYNLKAMKAGAANQGVNAGLSNIFNGLQNYTNMQMLNKEYGAGSNSNNTETSASGNNNGLSGITSDWLLRNRKRKSILG